MASDRKSVEAEILVLSSAILMGKSTEEEIKRVTKLAIDNDCQDILAREFKDIDAAIAAGSN